MSEFQNVPDGWKVVRLDELVEIQQGKAVSKKNRIGDNQRPFLRTRNLDWGRFDLADLDHMHFTEAQEQRLSLKDGDLLICEGGDIGRTAIWREEVPGCYYQNHLHRARVRDREVVSPEYLLYWLWYAFEIGELYFGRGNITTIPNLSKSKLSELPVALPPLPQQADIAELLQLIQTTSAQLQEKIGLTEELFGRTISDLMTGQVRVSPGSMESADG